MNKNEKIKKNNNNNKNVKCGSNSVIVIANSDNDSNQTVLITVILMIGMTAKTINDKGQKNNKIILTISCLLHLIVSQLLRHICHQYL